MNKAICFIVPETLMHKKKNGCGDNYKSEHPFPPSGLPAVLVGRAFTAEITCVLIGTNELYFTSMFYKYFII